MAEPALEVAIVGSGFSGLAMAIQLAKAGRRSFTIFEKADQLGGTWRDNHYPGCACDVPSHLYSFSFEPNPGWTRQFAPQEEILAYLRRCADKYRLGPHLRLGTGIARAAFDETQGLWRLVTDAGHEVTARHLVFGIGALSRPALPRLAGLERFAGKTFHSAAWDHAYDLAGKRVAVVGTGASAIQFIPQIAGRVAKLDVYQRTPPWILPKPDRAVTGFERRLFAALPFTQRLVRAWIYATFELRTLGFLVDPRLMRYVALRGERHLRNQVRDPALRALLTPNYLPGCKRILMADDYYPVFAQAHVELVTDGIDHVTERGLVTRDGALRPADAILFGTGFRVTDLLTPLEVKGRGGVDLNESWRAGIEAYLGTTISGFPNLYMLMGPNTGLGHNSMVFMIEAQVRYALACMATARARGAAFADVRPDAQAAFNGALQPRLQRSVWASGCQSWYLDEHGKNSTVWPGFTFEFWARTLRMNPRDYEFSPT